MRTDRQFIVYPADASDECGKGFPDVDRGKTVELTLGQRQSSAQAARLSRAHFESISALVATVEVKDAFTRQHSVRVARYSRRIAQRLRLGTALTERLARSRLLGVQTERAAARQVTGLVVPAPVIPDRVPPVGAGRGVVVIHGADGDCQRRIARRTDAAVALGTVGVVSAVVPRCKPGVPAGTRTINGTRCPPS